MKPLFSSSALKLIATGTMLVDHVGILFFPQEMWWRVIGRISFPLFAFLVAEGFRRTSHLENYGIRLFLFAFISQIPFALFLATAGYQTVGLNIFFTLGFGLLALVFAQRFPAIVSVPAIIAIVLLAEILRMDYGAYGILTILASSLLFTRRKLGAASLAALPFIQSSLQALAGIFFVQFAAVLSLPFALFYNGERGRHLPRAFFYWFYPVHLLVLWLIWYALS